MDWEHSPSVQGKLPEGITDWHLKDQEKLGQKKENSGKKPKPDGWKRVSGIKTWRQRDHILSSFYNSLVVWPWAAAYLFWTSVSLSEKYG